MEPKFLNIGLIEPSDLLCEGLTNILLRQNHRMNLFRIADLDDFRRSVINVKFDIIIIDTILIQNRIKQFRTYKGENPGIKWIGLVHSLINSEIITEFNTVISLDDNAEVILKKIVNQSEEKKMKSIQNEQLSSREIDVLKLLSGGMSNKEIADKLNVSIHTVISHRKNITQKTGIKSQSGLTIYAISNNIISL